MRRVLWAVFALAGLGLAACGPGGGDVAAEDGPGAVAWRPGQGAGAAAGDADPHRTGLLPATPAERAWLAAHRTAAADIRPNALALERLRAQRVLRGLRPLRPAAVMAAWSGVGGIELRSRTLPAAVDNSALDAFPPIRSQGNLGSCAAFSTTYYQWTHMVALAEGWDAKNGGDDYRMSPKWTYTMVNDGTDGGSTSMAPFNVLERHGCASWAQFPYGGSNTPANYRPWCMQTEVWRSALRYRLDAMGSLYGLDRIDGLLALKQMLANGYVLHIATYINSWQFLPGGIPDDPATAADDPYVGQAVCHWMNGTDGGHGMTIVGYDDAIWVDVDQDGSLDEGEKGALKIANSWGSGWRNGGFAWIAYDALREVSRVEGAPGNNRISAFDGAIWATVRPDYAPLLTAEGTLSHAERDQLQVTLGRGAVGDAEPSERAFLAAPSYSGGPWAFDGGDSAVALTFAFDFSDIAPPQGTAQRYFLGVRDREAGLAAELADFKLVDHLNGQQAWAANTPQTVDDAQGYAWVDFTFSNANTPPSLSALADQIIPVNGQTAALPLTVDDAESPAADLTLRAESDNGQLVEVPGVIFGGAGADRTVQVVPLPFATGSAPIRIEVSDGVDATVERFTVHVTAGGNTPPSISPIADLATPAGVASAPIAFTVADAETPLDELQIEVQASLLGYEVTGSGADRTLRVCPYPFAEGEIEIGVRVSDGELSDTARFVLTVEPGPANSPPTISAIADQATDAGVPTAPIAFTVGDAETDPAFLHVMFDSDNWSLFRFDGVHFGGAGADRTVTLCPAGGEHGDATITLRVWDGELEAQTQFQIAVADTGNTPPLLGAVADQVIPVNASTGPIPFSLSDAETPAEFLTVQRSNDNWDLVPFNGLQLGGAGEQRTVTVTPYLGEHGAASITLRVNDGAHEVSRSFTVTVDPELLCGNGVIDAGETCDPPQTCPAGCDDGDACTADSSSGSAAECSLACSHDPIVACSGGDGCCPAGCSSLDDGDCAVVCGNGVVEAGESCDPPASCPADCDDGDACTADSSSGSAAGCDLACSHDPIVDCSGGDGCCPAGCSSLDDGDCAVVCGNGVVEAGETCDPPASCPADCDDGDACTLDLTTGSAANCNLDCSHDAITACSGGDACCPPGCDSGSDADCAARCGNGVIDAGETCDPPETCPADCDDGDACTADSSTGAAADCDLACAHTPIAECAAGDGCCPAGCSSPQDSDCPPAAPPTIEGGCGCQAAPGQTWLLWPALLIGLRLRRRRTDSGALGPRRCG